MHTEQGILNALFCWGRGFNIGNIYSHPERQKKEGETGKGGLSRKRENRVAVGLRWGSPEEGVNSSSKVKGNMEKLGFLLSL